MGGGLGSPHVGPGPQFLRPKVFERCPQLGLRSSHRRWFLASLQNSTERPTGVGGRVGLRRSVGACRLVLIISDCKQGDRSLGLGVSEPQTQLPENLLVSPPTSQGAASPPPIGRV